MERTVIKMHNSNSSLIEKFQNLNQKDFYLILLLCFFSCLYTHLSLAVTHFSIRMKEYMLKWPREWWWMEPFSLSQKDNFPL
jgi:hypothetical protein